MTSTTDTPKPATANPATPNAATTTPGTVTLRLRRAATVAIAALAVVAAVKVATGPAERPHFADAAAEAPSAPDGALLVDGSEQPVVDGALPDGSVEGSEMFEGADDSADMSVGSGDEDMGSGGSEVPDGYDDDASIGAMSDEEFDDSMWADEDGTQRSPGPRSGRSGGEASSESGPDGDWPEEADEHLGDPAAADPSGDDASDGAAAPEAGTGAAPSGASTTTAATGGVNRPPTIPSRTIENAIPVGQPVTLFSDSALAAGWDDPDGTSDWLCLDFAPERKDFWLDGADCTGAGLWAKVPVAGVYTVQVRVREATAAQPGGIGPLSSEAVTLRLIAR